MSRMSPAPDAEQVAPPPAEQVHVAPVSAAGRLSATTAPGTSDGPALVTVIVYVIVSPGTAVVAPSVLATTRSASATTVVVSVAVLFPGVGSRPGPGMVTDAVLSSAPVNPASIVASTVIVTSPPAARSTVVAMLPVPDGWSQFEPGVATQVQVAPVSAAGRASVTGASAIADGPAFVTVIV
jgi:hypothetical protein